jgi:hypothetical protein
MVAAASGLKVRDALSPGLHSCHLLKGSPAQPPADLLDCLPRLRFPDANEKGESEAKFRVKNCLKQMKTLQGEQITRLANVNAC